MKYRENFIASLKFEFLQVQLKFDFRYGRNIEKKQISSHLQFCLVYNIV